MRLQLLQLIAIGIPILTQIWLARSLGPFGYGRFVFVAAIASYFMLVCDFGFGWSASRAIAVHRDDDKRCAQIVCTTYCAKLALFLAAMALLAVLIVTVDEFRAEAGLLVVAVGMILGSVLSPMWFFIGTERAHLGHGVDIVGKLLTAGIAVWAVRDSDDVSFAVVGASLGGIGAGVLGLALLARDKSLHWERPQAAEIMGAVKTALPLFLSTSAVSLYTTANGLVLGFLGSREEVAFFGAAHRIVAAASIVLIPFHQVFYPRISHELHHQPRSAVRTLGLALLAQGSLGFLITIVLLLCAEPIVVLLFGESFAAAGESLAWMAVVPALVGVASVFSNFVLMGLARDRLHLCMTFIAAAVNLTILFCFGSTGGAVAAAGGLVAAESFVLIFSVIAGVALLRKALTTAAA
jgi:PST family polysaccharide transporter